jgi:microcystin-dependent protein
MSALIFANNAKTNLATALTSTATTITLTPGAGVKFPQPVGAQYFVMTLTDAATGLVNEIIYITSRSNDVLTAVRGQEGTLAKAWLIGDYASCFPTAGTQATFIQPDQLQQGLYGYSVGAGTVNAITASISSDLNTIPDGMPLIVKAFGVNTSVVTLQLSLGGSVQTAYPIVKGNNNALVGGDIPVAGYQIQLNWSATFASFIMQNPATGISSIPSGSIFQFPCATAPTGFLLCNGQLVSRATYAALFAFANASGNIVSDSAWTGGAYGSFSTGDGATTFRLPQYGGYFLRALDNGNGIDPSRTIGSIQGGQVVSHNHSASSSTNAVSNSSSSASAISTVSDSGHFHSEGINLALMGSSYVGNGNNAYSGGGATNFGTNGTPYPTNTAYTGVTVNTSVSVATNTNTNANTSTTIGYTGGSETRPINVSVLTCMKY